MKKLLIKHKLLPVLVSVMVLMVAGLMIAPKAKAATYSVINTNDSGAGSLRQAIIDANANAGSDIISFAIAGAGQHTITLSSSLPLITDTVTINGLSQSGSVCNGTSTMPNIVINLNGQGNPIQFLAGAENSEINGLAIYGSLNNSYAVLLDTDSVTVRCNFFGTTDGITSVSVGNNSDWLHMEGADLIIGGTADTDTNVFLGSGALISDDGLAAGGVTISHNYISLGLDGTTVATSPNGGLALGSIYTSVTIENNHLGGIPNGITFAAGASGTSNVVIQYNTIGTTADGQTAIGGTGYGINSVADLDTVLIANNVITSASERSAILLASQPTSSVTVQDNMLNVSADGTTAFTTDASGLISNAPGSHDWFVSGNTVFSGLYEGILINNTGDNFLITNNTIGMDATRTNCFAGQQHGIDLSNSITESVIGGTDPADANVVCSTGTATGITFAGSLTDKVSVIGNLVRSGGAALNVISQALTAPTIAGTTEAGSNTDVTFSFTAPAGDYRIELYQNTAAVNGGGYPDLTTFVGYVDVTATGSQQSVTHTFSGTGLTYLASTITQKDDSVDGFGTTSAVGAAQYQTDVAVETTDGVDTLQIGIATHDMTQVFTNLGPSSITTIHFAGVSSACFDVTGVSTDGTATSAGSYATDTWTGILDPGQTLILTYTGDVTCGAGNTLSFDNSVTSLENGGSDVTDTTNGDSYSDTTDIIDPPVDLEVTTTDGATDVLTGTTGHEITQTFVNNGPNDVTDIDFNLSSTTCFTIVSTTTGGSATVTGSYGSNHWSGLLAVGQTLTIDYIGDITCSAGDTMVFTNEVTQVQYDGESLYVTNGDNDYTDSTNVVAPRTDLEVSKVLDNPEDLAPGATLHYTLTLTNNGPQSIDLTSFDGSGMNPFASNLFLDIAPPDLTFVSGSSTNPDIACDYFAPASAAGPLFANHSDYSINACSYGGSSVLASGDSISTTISMTVSNDSSLDFTNYVVTGWPENDPDLNDLAAPLQNGEEIIDSYLVTGINNFAQSAPVVDMSLTKALVGSPVVQGGNTVSYDITLHNKGPMTLDLASYSTNLFTDIYPGADMAFVDTNDPDLACTDLGPGSAAYLGDAGSAHPDHQLLVCAYAGTSHLVAPGQDYTVRLNFSFNAHPATSFTNYVSTTSFVTDPDTQALVDAFSGATQDILDTFANENFGKATYTPSGNNGGSSGGLAGTGQNQLVLIVLAASLMAVAATGIALSRKKH